MKIENIFLVLLGLCQILLLGLRIQSHLVIIIHQIIFTQYLYYGRWIVVLYKGESVKTHPSPLVWLPPKPFSQHFFIWRLLSVLWQGKWPAPHKLSCLIAHLQSPIVCITVGTMNNHLSFLKGALEFQPIRVNLRVAGAFPRRIAHWGKASWFLHVNKMSFRSI